MFTGIVEATTEVLSVTKEGSGLRLWLKGVWPDVYLDQSISHDGVCLTVAELEAPQEDQATNYAVVAVEETLLKTTLGGWEAGKRINLERCMPANGRFDGHVVQGHVDARGKLLALEDRHGSWLLRIGFPMEMAPFLVEKGSICVNGTSLTCFEVGDDAFTVTLIPYTWEHTALSSLEVGDAVNLEFDIIGKYVQRMLAYRALTQ